MTTSGELLARIERIPPLSLGVGSLVTDPGVIAQRYGSFLQFSQPTESESPDSLRKAETLLPNMDPILHQFLRGPWLGHELSHGDEQLNTLTAIGLTPLPRVEKVDKKTEFAGAIAGISPGFHDIAECMVLMYAGMGEKETLDEYVAIARDMANFGEYTLSKQMMWPSAQHEARHLGFYTTIFREKFARLRPWQAKFVAKGVPAVYPPVGVQRGNDERKRALGKALYTRYGDNDRQDAMNRKSNDLEGYVAKLVGDISVRPFILRRYEDAVNSYLTNEDLAT